jgi:deoxyribodipyrimidine photo-lyase
MTTAIWWVRRDLRLTDNQALHAATQHAEAVLPLFIIDPNLWESEWVGDKRLAFMLGGLRALDEALRECGSRLIVREGDPWEVLPALMDEAGADAVFAEADYSPYARERDRRVAEAVRLTVTEGVAIRPPGTVLKSDGDPYVVYSYFKRLWLEWTPPGKGDVIDAPGELSTPALDSAGIPAEPALPDEVPFIPGEAAAEERLRAFITGEDAPIYAYDKKRDRTDLDATSRLSPYLRFGMISGRRAAVAAYYAMGQVHGNSNAYDNAKTWLEELIWRDFYIHILYHFPKVRGANFNEKYDPLAWQNDEDDFRAWCEGRTGYPIVDAAMRQMTTIGWMHNRARMIVASFLTKDLLVDWKKGERFFMQHLVDGDPAANNGGWQWAAGTGTDAQPYFRIFNPTSQAKKHDPQGDYIRRWVPELAAVPDEHIHEPWKMDEDAQEAAGCVIGEDYPAPIIDHSKARERTLAAYKAARGD